PLMRFYPKKNEKRFEKSERQNKKRLQSFYAFAFDPFDVQGNKTGLMVTHDAFFYVSATPYKSDLDAGISFSEFFAHSQPWIQMAC
ncbi:unnamed protein product, partial [marine sediment metagenome]